MLAVLFDITVTILVQHRYFVDIGYVLRLYLS